MTIDRGNGDGDGEEAEPALCRDRRQLPSASAQLEELLGYPWPFAGRPPQHDLGTWTVTDDWPRPVPVTHEEVEVFERWFCDLFDELCGPDA